VREVDMAACEFEDVLNTAAMSRVFERHLAGEACVTACRVVRQRHRPGHRRFVQYAVSVTHHDGHADELRVTGQWHAERGHTAALSARLERRSRDAAARWTAALPPVFHDAATGMLATTYPWDRRLPALVDVASGRAARLLRPMSEWMGVERSALTQCVVETVRYREQLNAVCRYTLTTSLDTAPRRASFYVKLYGDHRGADAVARLGWLAQVTPADQDTARVQPAVAYDRVLRALVLAAAPGLPLDAAPLDDVSSPLATLARTAKALAAFGGRPLPASPRLPRVDRAAATTRSAAALSEAMPDRASDVSQLAARAMVRLTDGPDRLVHGDLKLEHVFVDGDEIWLVDLDSCHRGDALWDLALLQARWWAARDGEGAHGLGETGRRMLAQAYLADSDAGARMRLPALAACAYLDVAAGLAKRQDAEWLPRTRRLLDEADRALEVRE
jgi:Ser/Thr protein kinase RdoA (MazF antagonist)